MNTRESRKPLVQLFLEIKRMPWVSDFHMWVHPNLTGNGVEHWVYVARIDGLRTAYAAYPTRPLPAGTLEVLLSKACRGLGGLKP